MIFEIIWRDFFKYISKIHGSKIFKIGGILEKNILGIMIKSYLKSGLMVKHQNHL